MQRGAGCSSWRGIQFADGVVSAPVQKGKLPPEKSFVEVLTQNVFVSAIKKAEDSKAVIIRIFEVEGKKTAARIRISDIVKPDSKAVETDILEKAFGKEYGKNGR